MSAGYNDGCWVVGVFVGTLVILVLFFWERLFSFFLYFHFVDFVNSFFDGWLDTDILCKTVKAVV